MQTWSFSRHLKILQWLPLVFRIKSKHFIMSYRALCNLILPGFPASFPPFLPQIVNLSCTKLLTWNFWNTTYCFIIQCTHTCSSCCLECPHISLLSPMHDEYLLIPQGWALALFPLKFFTELFSWYSSKPECTTFTLPIMLYTFVYSLSLLLACRTLKSHPSILYTSTVLWVEEYTCWIYLVIFFECFLCTRKTLQNVLWWIMQVLFPFRRQFLSLLQILYPVCPLLCDLSLFFLYIHTLSYPSISLALIADNSQICPPSEELFLKLQMLPGLVWSSMNSLWIP